MTDDGETGDASAGEVAGTGGDRSGVGRLDEDTQTADPVPWTLVHLTADSSPGMRSLAVLLAWLAEQPAVTLHTVLWLPGWADPDPLKVGTFHDVARDHRAPTSLVLRRTGFARAAGFLTARAARSTLATAPRSGVLFLNSASCVVALRYLPPGERTVVTCLQPSDREADPPLAAERVQRLVEVTDVWLAADEQTRDWAADAWGIDAEAVRVIGELLGPSEFVELDVSTDHHHVALAVAGAPWFRSDHTARLVQALLRLRPELRLDLLWAEVEQEEHLGPLLADLRTLGVRERLRLPVAHDEVHEQLRRSHALAVTTPHEEPPWLVTEAAANGLPVVCFDSHPHARDVGRSIEGVVVPYLDVVGMAEAVLALRDREAHQASRPELARRDVRVVGPQLVDLTRQVLS